MRILLTDIQSGVFNAAYLSIFSLICCIKLFIFFIKFAIDRYGYDDIDFICLLALRQISMQSNIDYIVNKCSFSGLTESSSFSSQASRSNFSLRGIEKLPGCLLYTSDAADE